MNVSDLLLKVMARHDVSEIYGIPGDAINDVLDAIRRQDQIRFVQVRHEEVGAFAASAQAKLTGKLSACLGTSGPGAIHLLNGLYDAKMDHAPVLAITGQVATGYIGTSYHQEVDTRHLFSDVSVYNEMVTTIDQLPDIFQSACRAAIAHRGVAHISLPTNISNQKVSVDADRLITFSLPGLTVPLPADCDRAIELIEQAERPAILAGIGCSGSRGALLAFAEHIKAPIVRSLRAKDFIDDDHRQCLGGAGLLGDAAGVAALEQCDLLLMAGTDFPYKDFFPEDARFIQIDNVGTHIGRRHAVDVGLIGDVGPTLAELQSRIKPKTDRSFFDEMCAKRDGWRKRLGDAMESSNATPIKPPRLMAEITRVAPKDTVFVCDTGTCTAWSARHLRVSDGQRYTLSGGLASMAFALPAAIGAQFAYPDRTVIGIAGDGGFGMLMADFVTAVRYDLPIVMIVLRNEKLGFIALEQESAGLPQYGIELTNPDFAQFARACGGLGFTVTEPGEIGPSLEQALSARKASVIDVAVDPDALILPPKITIGQAANFSLAKVREALEGW